MCKAVLSCVLYAPIPGDPFKSSDPFGTDDPFKDAFGTSGASDKVRDDQSEKVLSELTAMKTA